MISSSISCSLYMQPFCISIHCIIKDLRNLEAQKHQPRFKIPLYGERSHRGASYGVSHALITWYEHTSDQDGQSVAASQDGWHDRQARGVPTVLCSTTAMWWRDYSDTSGRPLTASWLTLSSIIHNISRRHDRQKMNSNRSTRSGQ